jgi:hypothetical protein
MLVAEKVCPDNCRSQADVAIGAIIMSHYSTPLQMIRLRDRGRRGTALVFPGSERRVPS